MGQSFIIAEPTHASPSAATFTFAGAPNASIPDNSSSGVSNTVTIVDPIQISSLEIYVNATHTTVGDLIITISNGTTTVTLMDRPGRTSSGRGCRYNNVDAAFSDVYGTAVESMCYTSGPAIAGNVQPHNSMSAYNGTMAAANWTLTIADRYSGDTGTFVSWEVRVTGTLIVPQVVPGSISSYGCNSGNLVANYTIANVPAGTYRFVAGAWIDDINLGGSQDNGGHIMWREWTAAHAGGTVAVTLPLTQTFDSSTMGLTVYRADWVPTFGSNTLPANTHIRIFYQLYSSDYRIQYGSGEILVASCAG